MKGYAIIYVWGAYGPTPLQWELFLSQGWRPLVAAYPASVLCVVISPDQALIARLPAETILCSVTDSTREQDIWIDAVAHVLDAGPSDGFCAYVRILSTAIGPFVPSYATLWINIFMKHLEGNTACIGPTIRVWQDLSHSPEFVAYVQDYMMVFRADVLPLTLTDNRDTVSYDNWAHDVCRRLLRSGYGLTCMVPEYQNRDYSHLRGLWNYDAGLTEGDVTYPGFRCHGRDLHPYETIFVSMEHRLQLEATCSLAQLLTGRLKGRSLGEGATVRSST